MYDMNGIVYINGNLVPAAEAKIPAFDYGFLFGYALFETMHAYNSTVFRLDRHIQRMVNSANTLGLSLDAVELTNAVQDTVRVNNLQEARIRLTVSAGAGHPVADLASCSKPTVMVVAIPYTPLSPETYEKGYRMVISEIRRNSRSPVAVMKKTDYLESILAKQSARAAGADDALFLNDRGYLTEGTANNIFIVSKGLLKTPPVVAGVLPGITRAVILEMARATAISNKETNIRLAALFTADEVFLTSSLMEIMPVTMIDGQMVGSGRPGPVTRRLMQAFRETVRCETGSQR